jgi:hypothetical protein
VSVPAAAALSGHGALSASFPLCYFQVVQTPVESATTPSAGTTPLLTTLTGTVTITPVLPEIDAAPPATTLILAPIYGELTGGQLFAQDGGVGMWLLDSINLNTELVYRVDYNVPGTPFLPNTFWFRAPGNGQQINLTSVRRMSWIGVDAAGAGLDYDPPVYFTPSRCSHALAGVGTASATAHATEFLEAATLGGRGRLA